MALRFRNSVQEMNRRKISVYICLLFVCCLLLVFVLKGKGAMFSSRLSWKSLFI